MRELIQEIKSLIAKCHHYSKELSQKYGNDDPRVGCMNDIGNGAKLTLELLSFYERLWSKEVIDKPEIINKLRQQNGERCNMITKWLFVNTISTLEYNIRRLVKGSGNPLEECCREDVGFWSSLGNISLRHKIMKSDKSEIGKFIIEMRNSIVHNNCIPRITAEVEIDQRKFIMKRDEMSKGELDTFAIFVSWLTDWFFDWCQRIEKIK